MSTEFRIGMSEGRNSSRVLKPPGGGHSQIFGGPEEEVPKKNHQKTAISSCFDPVPAKVEDKTDAQSEKIDVPEKIQEENGTNGSTNGNNTNGDAVDESKKNDLNEAKSEFNEAKSELNEAKSEGTPQRKRVPPGGFSSGGFW